MATNFFEDFATSGDPYVKELMQIVNEKGIVIPTEPEVCCFIRFTQIHDSFQKVKELIDSFRSDRLANISVDVRLN